MFELLVMFGIIGALFFLTFLVLTILGLVLLGIDWIFNTHFGRKAVKTFIAFLKDEYYEGA